MHVIGATETTDADAAAIPRQITWSSKLLLGKMWKNHSGRKSVLAPVEKVLLQDVFEDHKQGIQVTGIQVTMRIVRKYAEKKMPSLLQKTREANCQVIRHFLH